MEWLRTAAKGALERSQFDLDRLIDRVLKDYREDFLKRKVSVERTEFPQVYAHESLVDIVFRALIENALIHSKTEDFMLKLTVDVMDEAYKFGIYNSGSQIDSKRLESIFDPFQQLSPSVDAASGMGLSICRRIIERHHGTISGRSGEDFVLIEFTLPYR